MRATRAALAVGAATIALAVAGCGGDDDTTGGGAYGGTPSGGSGTTASGGGAYGGGGGSSAKASGAAVVSVSDNAMLGTILVDSKGFTLYDFHKDKGGKSACYGACAAAWPPLITSGTPQPEKGAKASLLGSVERTDGSEQVTYAGHPLYTYAGDSQPGQANGNDLEQFGAEWYALTPSGEEPEG